MAQLSPALEGGGLYIPLNGSEVCLDGDTIELPEAQHRVLLCLCFKPNHRATFFEIVEYTCLEEDEVKTAIRGLRTKLRRFFCTTTAGFILRIDSESE